MDKHLLISDGSIFAVKIVSNSPSRWNNFVIFSISLGGYRQSSSGKAINADAACLAPKFFDLDASLKFTLLCIIGSFSLHFL